MKYGAVRKFSQKAFCKVGTSVLSFSAFFRLSSCSCNDDDHVSSLTLPTADCTVMRADGYGDSHDNRDVLGFAKLEM